MDNPRSSVGCSGAVESTRRFSFTIVYHSHSRASGVGVVHGILNDNAWLLLVQSAKAKHPPMSISTA